MSSGERQLISIARAFAHRPDLIVFDEATSYVDTEAEEKIRVAVSNLKELKTLSKNTDDAQPQKVSYIAIAHRLRSAVTADNILVLKSGRVIEYGPHEALLERKGLYYRMHQASMLNGDSETNRPHSAEHDKYRCRYHK